MKVYVIMDVFKDGDGIDSIFVKHQNALDYWMKASEEKSDGFYMVTIETKDNLILN